MRVHEIRRFCLRWRRVGIRTVSVIPFCAPASAPRSSAKKTISSRFINDAETQWVLSRPLIAPRPALKSSAISGFSTLHAHHSDGRFWVRQAMYGSGDQLAKSRLHQRSSRAECPRSQDAWAVSPQVKTRSGGCSLFLNPCPFSGQLPDLLCQPWSP